MSEKDFKGEGLLTEADSVCLWLKFDPVQYAKDYRESVRFEFLREVKNDLNETKYESLNVNNDLSKISLPNLCAFETILKCIHEKILSPEIAKRFKEQEELTKAIEGITGAPGPSEGEKHDC